MIAWLKEYILSVTSIGIIGLMIDCILPGGNIKKYAAFGLSVILSIALIQPVINFEVKNISFDVDTSVYNADYTQAVKSTVNSVKGYEEAEVYVQQENNKIISVVIKSTGNKLLEEAMEKTTADFLKNMLVAVYGVEKEKIYISE